MKKLLTLCALLGLLTGLAGCEKKQGEVKSQTTVTTPEGSTTTTDTQKVETTGDNPPATK